VRDTSPLFRRDFRLLWAGASVSMLGNHFTLIALPTLAILELDFSATEVGLLGALRYLPFALLGLPAGVLADRVRRRPVMIVCDVGSLLALFSLVVTSAAGALSVAQLYAVALATGVFHVFSDVAFNSYVARVAGTDRILTANARMAASGAVTSLAGPPTAGLAIVAVGAARALAFDALSFLVSALALIRIRTSEPRCERTLTTLGWRALAADLVGGLRVIARDRTLRNLLACGATKNVGEAAFVAILMLFMYRSLRFSPTEVGLVFAIASVGALAGALGLLRATRRIGFGTALVSSVVVMGSALVATPLALAGHPFAVLGVLLFLAWFATTIYDTSEVALTQAAVADALRGRIAATLRTLTWGAKSVGFALGGVVAAQFGLVAGLVVGGGLVLGAAGWLLAGRLPAVTEDWFADAGEAGEPSEPRARPTPKTAPATL
jgi:MFS family permease